MSSGHHFTGTGDWQAGLEVRIDSTGLSPHGALKLKSKHIYCPGVERIHQAVSSWFFLVQSVPQTHEKLS